MAALAILISTQIPHHPGLCLREMMGSSKAKSKPDLARASGPDGVVDLEPSLIIRGRDHQAKYATKGSN